MRDIKETLSYQKLKKTLLWHIVFACAILVCGAVIGLIVSDGKTDLFLSGIRFSGVICLFVFLPCIVNNALKMRWFKKAYENCEQPLKSETFHIEGLPLLKRAEMRCLVYITVADRQYSSPYIFSAKDVSEMKDKALVYLIDEGTLYPLWSQEK